MGRNVNRVWQRLSSEERPLKFLISRILWSTGICRLFTIQRSGYSLRFFPSSSSATHWVDPSWILDDEVFFESYLAEGDCVVDVGANIGALTLKAARIVGDRGRVVSFEGHPRIASYVRGNVELNGFSNIELHQCALGEKEGTVSFSNRRSDEQNRVVDSGLLVPMRTLDNCLPATATIDLLKVDVEGYERMVFLGAEETLTRCECVYFESAKRHCDKFGYRQGDVIELLMQAGFEVYKRDGRKISLLDARYEADCLENLIAIRDLDRFLKRTDYAVTG